MPEVSRRHGMTVVRLAPGEKLATDPRVYQTSPGEWFALIERPAHVSDAPVYAIARVGQGSSPEIRRYQGTGAMNIRALCTFAAVENEKHLNWRT